MGQVQLIRAYRMQSGGGMPPAKPEPNELLFQLRRPVSFIWASSGTMLENMIHQIDECSC